MALSDRSIALTAVVVGIAFGIGGIISGYYFYEKSIRERLPVVSVDPVRTNIVNSADLSDLTILYHGDPIKQTSVTSLRIYFWNRGDLPIIKAAHDILGNYIFDSLAVQNGRFGPTQIIGSGSWPPPIIIPGESLIAAGIISSESAMPVWANASRKDTACGDDPKTRNPKNTPLEWTRGWKETIQSGLPAWELAALKTSSIWDAKKPHSGSVPAQDNSTLPPGPPASARTRLAFCSSLTVRHLAACSTRATCALADAALAVAVAISLLATAASLSNAATCNSRTCFTVASNGPDIQSEPNSITTPSATNPAANSLAIDIQDNQYSALGKAEASIERSRRLSLIIYGLVAVWLCLRLMGRWRRR